MLEESGAFVTINSNKAPNQSAKPTNSSYASNHAKEQKSEMFTMFEEMELHS
jgi:hypothetical protein